MASGVAVLADNETKAQHEFLFANSGFLSLLGIGSHKQKLIGIDAHSLSAKQIPLIRQSALPNEIETLLYSKIRKQIFHPYDVQQRKRRSLAMG
jgi:hypothetical protein